MARESNHSFGTQLRHLRTAAHLTQEQLAERAGLTVKAISALERGERRHPYPHTVQALAAALDLSDDERAMLFAAIPRRGSVEGPPPQENIPASPPIPSTLLVGRDADVSAILRLIENGERRLLTLIGPGGVGKTSLAAHMTHAVASQFGDGIVWVALAAVVDPALVLSSIASALDLRAASDELIRTALHRSLRTKHLLLVLDNFEHVMGAAAEVAQLLVACPRVTVLVTSRAPLRLHDEQEYPVAPLALPSLDHVPRINEVAASPAAQLFVQRAQMVAPGFALTQQNAATIAAICRRLDGLPLAIELAAVRVKLLGTTGLLARLDRALPLLVSGPRDLPDRQQTMRRAIEWSHDLLDTGQQALFRRLAVFAGGWTLEAAEAVGADEHGEAGEVMDRLDQLVEQSLVMVELADESVRYRMLETIRAYALERLEASGEETAVRRLHCAYFARKLDERTTALFSSKMYGVWQEVGPDLDNIRGAWSWATKQGDYKALAQMGPSLQAICEIRGLWEEGLALFEDAAAALKTAADTPTARSEESNREIAWASGEILTLYGMRAARSGKLGEARARLHEGHELLEQRGDLLVRTGTLAWLGYIGFQLGAYNEARTWFTRSIELSRAHGDTFFLSMSESMLALVAQAQGADDALDLAQSGLAHWRVNGFPRGLTTGFWALSRVLLAQGAIEQAEEAAREGLRLATGAQDPWATGLALLQLGKAALAQHRLVEARYFVEESIAIFREIGEPWGRGMALVALGWVAQAQNKAAEAQVCWEEAVELGRAMRLDPVMLDAQFGLAYVRRTDRAAALALLDPIIPHPATEHQTREQAMVLRKTLTGGKGSAITILPSRVSNQQVTPTGEMLTPREVEVLQLLAEGQSNQSIAEELVVAVGTVKRHVNSILGKLEAQSRLEAVARARKLGII